MTPNQASEGEVMTNYNKRLDEIINSAYEGEVSWIHDQLDGTSVMDDAIKRIEDEKAKTKQAITSLIKELVAEAKPAEKDQQAESTLDDESRCRFYRYGGYNFAIDEFERNLLKALNKEK